jgi:arginyl-tRNA synthetase
VITRDLRQAVRAALAAAGCPADTDPGLRPSGAPGGYAASVALALSPRPRALAAALASTLGCVPWIESAEVTGPGYLSVTVTAEALAAVADRVAAAGPACVTSAALTGRTVPAAPPGDPLTAASWSAARAALAAVLTVRLAAAAGATVPAPAHSERLPPPPVPPPSALTGEIAAAVDFAGRDAVIFTLARTVPGQPVRIDPGIIARHRPGNPAYAVRYAHARAASGVRWAAAAREGTPGSSGGPPTREAAVLLDALSWLPERVAAAARRGRPDEFARYLEDLASVTVNVLSSAGGGRDRLALARAARTGLAAGLGLLEVSAPDRLLAET